MVGGIDMIFPVGFPEKHPMSAWAHKECARTNGKIVPKELRDPCRHWRVRGECVYGDECYFRHDEADRGNLIEEMSQKRSWGGRRVHTRNRCRVAIFRRFIMDTFELNDESRILDIAGGKGEMGFEMKNLRGITTTVIEPRKLSVGIFARRYKKGVYHRNMKRCSSKYVARSIADGTVPVDHIRLFMDHKFLRLLGLYGDQTDSICKVTQESLDEMFRAAEDVKMTRRGLAHEDGAIDCDDDCDACAQPEDDTGSEYNPDDDLHSNVIVDLETVLDRILNFDLVCGMHPDQATEPLVDLAVALNKPFAVVPCCVFSSMFPHRRLKSGSLVTNYDDFLQYLVEKDPEHIQIGELGFQGKNKVVYRV